MKNTYFKELEIARDMMFDLLKTIKTHKEGSNAQLDVLILVNLEHDLAACETDILNFFDGKNYVYTGKLLKRKEFNNFNLN